MKKNRTSKTKSRARPFIKWFVFLIVAISILVYSNNQKKRDIELNGIENIAIVSSVKYTSYIADERTGKRVSFYLLNLDYQFEGKQISKILELQPNEYDQQVGRKLNVGDTLKIIHSCVNPQNLKLK